MKKSLLVGIVCLASLLSSSLRAARTDFGSQSPTSSAGDSGAIGGSVRSKQETQRSFYVGLGPSGLWNLNTAGIGYYFNTGFGFSIDRAIMKIGAEFFGRSKSIGFVGGLGISYYILDGSQDFSPFGGLDFGYGAAREEGTGAWTNGFVLGPTIGLSAFRSADVNMEFSLKWGIFLASASQGTPNYSVFRVNLYF